MQSLCIRVSESTLDTHLLPEPTMTRTITTTFKSNYIECIYWLDTYLISQKQLKWIADIKTKIKMLLPDVEFIEYDKSYNYKTVSGESFNLKQLSDLWSIATKERPDIVVKKVKLPSLPHLDLLVPGNLDKVVMRELYQPMCVHAKNLYYYHSFSYEALMCGINEALGIIDYTLSPKLKRKFCESIYNNFSKELLSYPHKYKQKLLGKDKENERINRTKKLKNARVEAGKISEANNKALILQVLDNPLIIKPNGKYNVTAIATLTGLSRPTVSKLLKDLK